MQPTVTLSYKDESGSVQHVLVESNRFSIGRTPGNDLVIEDSMLSRRHALIESYDGISYISDCGSQNGTLVNDRPVIGAIALREGDIITLGGVYNVGVSFAAKPAEPAPSPPQSAPPPLSVQPLVNTESEATRHVVVAAASPATNPLLSAPLIAAAAAILIFVGALLVIFLSRGEESDRTTARRQERTGTTQSDNNGVAGRPGDEVTTRPANEAGGSAEQTANENSAEILSEQVEQAAIQVMRRISSDDKPYSFSEKALSDIKSKVVDYRVASELRPALNELRNNSSSLATQARREGIEPGLVIYAALAQTDGGRASRDLGGVARGMLPDLVTLRTTFGSGSADSSLIVIAAYKDGTGTKKSHPLLATMRRLVKRPLTQRNVWYLYSQGGINSQSYDFVVRFIALGVIAQNPRMFGIEVDPVNF